MSHSQVLFSFVSTGEEDLGHQVPRVAHLHLGPRRCGQCTCVCGDQCDGHLRHGPVHGAPEPFSGPPGVRGGLQRHHCGPASGRGLLPHGADAQGPECQPEEEGDHRRPAHPPEQHLHPLRLAARGGAPRHAAVDGADVPGLQRALRRPGGLPLGRRRARALGGPVAHRRLAAQGLSAHQPAALPHRQQVGAQGPAGEPGPAAPALQPAQRGEGRGAGGGGGRAGRALGQPAPGDVQHRPAAHLSGQRGGRGALRGLRGLPTQQGGAGPATQPRALAAARERRGIRGRGPGPQVLPAACLRGVLLPGGPGYARGRGRGRGQVHHADGLWAL